MTTINDIRQEIERLTQRRAELFHQLSEGHDPALAAGYLAEENGRPVFRSTP